ncbi:MAG: hypothetical protein JRJ87_27700 [Deltaproteobacteria bacterium]|nr:hypothetical protein [Deltaproteobacteria bacterium]
MDDQPRILNGTWTGSPVTDMGADEYCDTDFTVTGPFNPGDTLTIEISANGQANAPFMLYVAKNDLAMPLAPPPGIRHPLYGTVLLDGPHIAYGGPVLTGHLDASGNFFDNSSITIPGQTPIGLYVAMQAFITDTASGTGQGTNAATFRVGY